VEWSGVVDRNCESDLYLCLGRKVNWEGGETVGSGGDNVNGEKGDNETESGVNLNMQCQRGKKENREKLCRRKERLFCSWTTYSAGFAFFSKVIPLQARCGPEGG